MTIETHGRRETILYAETSTVMAVGKISVLDSHLMETFKLALQTRKRLN